MELPRNVGRNKHFLFSILMCLSLNAFHLILALYRIKCYLHVPATLSPRKEPLGTLLAGGYLGL
jgi:hypothetical protein